MNNQEIKLLTAEAFKLQPTGDEYADRRHSWAYDPQNRNKEMWWGAKQPYYLFLYLIAKLHNGGMALEVGTHQGIGFAHLAAGAKASGNPKSWTVGIDINPYEGAIEVPTKYSRCTFINDHSVNPNTIQKVATICQTESITINIMFIDATHTLKWVNAELNAYKHLFSESLVIIMDDCFRADNNTMLPECFAQLPGDQKLTFPGLHTDNCVGVAVCSKEMFRNWRPSDMEVFKQ
jgi:cephalosporin hydroxylase